MDDHRTRCPYCDTVLERSRPQTHERQGEGVVHVTDDVFETTVLQADQPVMVDFWAPWCGPCRIIGPVVEELADEYADKMIFAKLNTDENRETPTQYVVRGIPTLIFFSRGEEVDRVVGVVPKLALTEKIEQVLNLPAEAS
jgi:thioredoxin 1